MKTNGHYRYVYARALIRATVTKMRDTIMKKMLAQTLTHTYKRNHSLTHDETTSTSTNTHIINTRASTIIHAVHIHTLTDTHIVYTHISSHTHTHVTILYPS